MPSRNPGDPVCPCSARVGWEPAILNFKAVSKAEIPADSARSRQGASTSLELS